MLFGLMICVYHQLCRQLSGQL